MADSTLVPQSLTLPGPNANGGVNPSGAGVGGYADPEPPNTVVTHGPGRSITNNRTDASIEAFERAGLLRVLAEPILTAISGETASFVAGGEFPIPNGLSCDTTKSPPVCQSQIDFKKFGVSLVFTPIVMTEGRISLKVMTESSDLSSENAITLQVPGSTQTLTIPSIRTRRAETLKLLQTGILSHVRQIPSMVGTE